MALNTCCMFVVAIAIFAHYFVPYNSNIPFTNNIVELTFSIIENLYIQPPWTCPTINITSPCEQRALERLRFVFNLTKYIPLWGLGIQSKTIYVNKDSGIYNSKVKLSMPIVLYESTFYSTTTTRKKRKLLLWFHYGGYVVGNAKDGLILQLSKMILEKDHNFLIASVDYRLAPEYQQEDSINDCFFALKYFTSPSVQNNYNLDVTNYFVGGASAGGGLAIEIALKAAAPLNNIKLKAHLAIVPMLSPYGSFQSHSYIRNALNLGLSTQSILWYWKASLYRSSESARSAHTLANLLKLEDSKYDVEIIKRISDSFVATADSDVLYNEGVEYIQILNEYNSSSKIISSRHHHEIYFTTHLGSMIYPSHWAGIVDFIISKK
jgi:acetyl esterase/lipase